MEASGAKRLKTEFTGSFGHNWSGCTMFGPELLPTSVQAYLHGRGRQIQFGPFCRGYIVVGLKGWPDAESEIARWYTIQFCVGKDHFKHPLGNINEIHGYLSHIDVLNPTLQVYLVADGEGVAFSCLSLNTDKGPLTDFPPMLRWRVKPQSVWLNGKLYVMGGCWFICADDEPWGEVFDPGTMQWSAMPPPPIRPRPNVMFTAPLEEERKILMGCRPNPQIFSFDVDTESWEPYHILDRYAYLPISGQSIVSHGVLYSVGRYFYAYDLRNKFFCEATPAEMGFIGEGYDDDWQGSHLLDLGNNNLCLVQILDDLRYIRVVVFESFIRVNGFGIPYLDVIHKGQKDYDLGVGPGVEMYLHRVMLLKQ